MNKLLNESDFVNTFNIELEPFNIVVDEGNKYKYKISNKYIAIAVTRNNRLESLVIKSVEPELIQQFLTIYNISPYTYTFHKIGTITTSYKDIIYPYSYAINTYTCMSEFLPKALKSKKPNFSIMDSEILTINLIDHYFARPSIINGRNIVLIRHSVNNSIINELLRKVNIVICKGTKYKLVNGELQREIITSDLAYEIGKILIEKYNNVNRRWLNTKSANSLLS